MTSRTFDYDTPRSGVVSCELTSVESILTKAKGKNVSIFLGAGFSKAWSNDYPLSNEIFSISEKDAAKERAEYKFFDLFDSLSLKWADDNASDTDKSNVFKMFKYTMDIYRRYPSLLPSHLDKHTIDFFESEIKAYIKKRFFDKVGIKEAELKLPSRIRTSQKDILSFFDKLSLSCNINVITTNYDIVIDRILHSLKCKKSILRGHPVHIDGKVQCPSSKGISLFKLNGGFEVVSQGDIFKVDYNSIEQASLSPNIILPSNEQIYDDKYFKNVFIKSSNKLRASDLLIFIGYSFPSEDHIIRFLLKSFLDADSVDKETIIISRSKDSAIRNHEASCDLFKELDDNSGVYYYGGAFAQLCNEMAKLP